MRILCFVIPTLTVMIPGLIADKTLSVNLKELEADELIIRKEYPRIPPRVEYCLSERGRSPMVVPDQLCIWGNKADGKLQLRNFYAY